MAKIHFIGGEKGGVGKSVVARLLAQYMIDRQIPFFGFDTDKSHGALLRYYKDFASPTVIDRYESLDTLIELAANNPDARILVDLAAQTHEPLSKWINESGVLDLAKELGIEICYWNVLDSGKDSVDLLGKLLDQFGGSLRYKLVLNELREDQFSILDASGHKERALELGADLMYLKKLHAPVMGKIDSNSYSFWAATNKELPGGNALGMLERQRLKLWLQNAYGALDTMGV